MEFHFFPRNLVNIEKIILGGKLQHLPKAPAFTNRYPYRETHTGSETKTHTQTHTYTCSSESHSTNYKIRQNSLPSTPILIHTQIDSQIDRDRETDNQTERQRETHRDTHTHTDRQKGEQEHTDGYTYRDTGLVCMEEKKSLTHTQTDL